MPAPDKKNRFDVDMHSLLAQVRNWPAQQIEKWRDKFNNLHQSNFTMGCDFADRGALRDAIFRFKMATYLKPQFPLAWYNLGVSHIRNGEPRQAKMALKKAMSQKPNYVEAAYMLATIDPAAVPAELRPTRMPEGMMEGFFTQMAPIYDQVEAQNKYQGAVQCVELLRAHVPATSGLRVVDIGCGTGTVAKLWRKVASSLIGVDVTEAMAVQARAAKAADDVAVFDAVHVADIRDVPMGSIAPESVDVALLVNMVQFIGDLQQTMRQLAAMLKPGGLALVTAEPCGGQAYSVMPATGRFGHSDPYILAVAQAAGLQADAPQKISLYPNTHVSAHILRKAVAA